MCNFFSFCTDGVGNRYYFDWEARKEILSQENPKYKPDSHASIAKYHNLDEDKLNKYEYDPINKIFTVDQINNQDDDRIPAEVWVRSLNFKNIIEPLIINDIVNPLKDLPMVKKPTNDDINALKNWIETKNLIDSVWDSVGYLVGDSIGSSVWNSVRDSVFDLVWYSVRSSVSASVYDSIRYSVATSVYDSIYAYIGSFFDIVHQYDLEPSNYLWNRGIVPSFDGTTWRLHSGPNAKVIYTLKPKN